MSINQRTLPQRKVALEGNQLSSTLLWFELPFTDTTNEGSYVFVLERADRLDGGEFRATLMTIDEFMYNFGTGGGAVDSVNGQTGVVVLNLDDINDVPAYPNDGYDYYLQENNGALTWELYVAGITEADVIGTQRAFTESQWLDVTVLTPSSNIFTPDFTTTTGSYTADIGANSTLANPVVPSGYSTGKTLAWDITFTITGAGGWTLAFGSSYRQDDGVDIDDIVSNNNTTGDVIQIFFVYKNGINYIQPFIPTAI